MIIYLVTANGKVSHTAYEHLEDAQTFIKNRVAEKDLLKQQPYYDVVSSIDYTHYRIEDVRVA